MAADARYSEDGRTWQDGTPIAWRIEPGVTRLVIGKPPVAGASDAGIELAVALPPSLREVYPSLVHLHLWQISNLTRLPELPESLRTLDVRGCVGLEEVAKLPVATETLDLAGCRQLKELPDAADLVRLYISDCRNLAQDELTAFLQNYRRLKKTRAMEDFEASGCPAVTCIRLLPRSLRRLVLNRCPNLTDLAGLEEFSLLRYLGLSECPALTELPGIPQGVQYLELYGSDKLKLFSGQSIGEYDRGNADDPNVAARIRSRAKFGDEQDVAACAKLLLLGDGRVGKTTLSKRLVWESLTKSEQQQPENAHLKPRGEPITHGVRYSRWETDLKLEPRDCRAAVQRAETAGISTDIFKGDSVRGSVRIWDFGGQEIYHQTHRIFASVGSVFLIVWNDQPVDEAALERERQETRGVDAVEWREMNKRRSLDYWLDYVDSLGSDKRVAIVCTYVPTGSQLPPWENSEKRLSLKKRGIPCFYVDSMEDHCGQNPQYLQLLDWIHESCGKVAEEISLFQPRFFKQTADLVEEILQRNQTVRTAGRSDQAIVLFSDTEWASRVRERHQQFASRHQLDDNDISAITGYLHDSGQIFRIGRGQHCSILVDQIWATRIIYELVRPQADPDGFCLFESIKRRFGYIQESVLLSFSEFQKIESADQRDLLIQYLEQCGILVPITSANKGQRLFLATEKWLLPPYEGQVKKLCDHIFGTVLHTEAGTDVEDLVLPDTRISEADFRRLITHLAKTFRERATVFREGMFATDSDIQPQYIFLIRWQPDQNGYLGTIQTRLAASTHQIDTIRRLAQDLLVGENSPLAQHRNRLLRHRLENLHFADMFFGSITEADIEVGISYSGKDKELVDALMTALRAGGIKRLYQYRDPSCRRDDLIMIKPFMQSLSNPPCLILVLSDAYLRSDPENWFCMWEFADAIQRLYDRRFTRQRVVVLYRHQQNLSGENLREIAANSLEKMSEHFHRLYEGLRRTDRTTSKEYLDRSDHFAEVIGEPLNRFCQMYASDGTYCDYVEDANAMLSFDKVIDSVRIALRETHHD